MTKRKVLQIGIDAVTKATRPIGEGICEHTVQMTSILGDSEQICSSLFKKAKEAFLNNFIPPEIQEVIKRYDLVGGKTTHDPKMRTFPDELTIKTKIIKVKTASIILFSQYLRPIDKEEYASSSQELVFTNESGEPVKIPDNLRSFFKSICIPNVAILKSATLISESMAVPIPTEIPAEVIVPEKKEIKRRYPLGDIWRFFARIFDWRTNIRSLRGLPILDVAFISNARDEIDLRYFGKKNPIGGHYNGLRYWLRNDIAGRIRVLDCTGDELCTNHKIRKKAKEAFISAVKWAEKNGAKVILLAAGTKRLFGDDGSRLKKLFPNLVFTIGDNGTMLFLRAETLRALKIMGLKPGNSRIAILGPYGFLGEMMVKTLQARGYNIIGAGPNSSKLKRIADHYQIDVCQDFSQIGEVDAVVACTHSKKISITTESVELIRRKNRKLLVVDVAAPPNFKECEYKKCRNIVVRLDAGGSYSPELDYVLGAISYKFFRFSRGVTFGCFAETLSLASALQRGIDIKDIDWFKVCKENMDFVAGLYEHDGFTIPSPCCFGKPVYSINLDLVS